MDPNTALQNLRNALNSGDLEEARESFNALDGWLSSGGFIPVDWSHARTHALLFGGQS
jgi:hypothetical protein